MDVENNTTGITEMCFSNGKTILRKILDYKN